MEVIIIFTALEKVLSVDDPKCQKLFADAVVLIAKQKVKPAIEKFLKIAKIFPDLFEIKFNLGVAFLLLSDFDSSFDYFNMASDIKPIPLAFADLAEISYKSGKYTLSKKAFDKLKSIDITDLTTLKLVGGSCIEIERWTEALNYHLKALELVNNDEDLLYKIGVLYYRLNQIDLSLEAYFKVINTNSKNYMALNNIASIYEQKEDFEKAKEYYQKALQICPEYNNAYENLISLNKRLNLS